VGEQEAIRKRKGAGETCASGREDPSGGGGRGVRVLGSGVG